SRARFFSRLDEQVNPARKENNGGHQVACSRPESFMGEIEVQHPRKREECTERLFLRGQQQRVLPRVAVRCRYDEPGQKMCQRIAARCDEILAFCLMRL